MGPAGSQAQQSFGTSPPPPARVDSPGISTPSPNSVLVRCSGRHALSPQSPLWPDTDTGAALAEVGISPTRTPLVFWGYWGRAPGGTGRGPPTPLAAVEMLCVCMAKEKGGAAPAARVWIPYIPPPDKEAETVAQGRGRVLSPFSGHLGLPSREAASRPGRLQSSLLCGAGLNLGASTLPGPLGPHLFFVGWVIGWFVHSFIHPSICLSTSIPHVF